MGAATYGGRWNTIGTKMVYTASSLALARCELARHINLESIPDGFSVYEIEIPNVEYSTIKPLPKGWDNNQEPIETKIAGDKIFTNSSILGFKVPSVCDNLSFNYVLNPESDSFQLVKVKRHYPFKA